MNIRSWGNIRTECVIIYGLGELYALCVSSDDEQNSVAKVNHCDMCHMSTFGFGSIS